MERGGDNRKGNMPRSYTFVIEYTAEDGHIGFYEIMWTRQGKHESDKGIHKKSVKAR